MFWSNDETFEDDDIETQAKHLHITGSRNPFLYQGRIHTRILNRSEIIQLLNFHNLLL